MFHKLPIPDHSAERYCLVSSVAQYAQEAIIAAANIGPSPELPFTHELPEPQKETGVA
ncbi:MAG: hypothetical protein HN341_02530 [Verrucomicrobia bacterium]|nr:hypothetical protein [Verrucomicrobiota bacterium]